MTIGSSSLSYRKPASNPYSTHKPSDDCRGSLTNWLSDYHVKCVGGTHDRLFNTTKVWMRPQEYLTQKQNQVYHCIQLHLWVIWCSLHFAASIIRFVAAVPFPTSSQTLSVHPSSHFSRPFVLLVLHDKHATILWGFKMYHKKLKGLNLTRIFLGFLLFKHPTIHLTDLKSKKRGINCMSLLLGAGQSMNGSHETMEKNTFVVIIL